MVAGGGFPRLWPATAALAGPLLPVYDKPLIYYPLSALLLAGIRRILVIAAPRDAPYFQRLLGGGEQWGISLSYAIAALDGLAQALVMGAEFTGRRPVALALGDRICYGRGWPARLQKAAEIKTGARLFACRVSPVQRQPASGDAAAALGCGEALAGLAPGGADPGLYFYDSTVAERARALPPSARNRPGLADLNRTYLGEGKLRVEVLSRAVKCLHITDPDSLLAAARSVKTAQQRQAARIGCPEESAWRMNFIGDEQLLELAAAAGQTPYAKYLQQLPARRDRERRS